MAAIPKGILPCPGCRMIATAFKKANESVKTNVMIYTSAFVLIVELLTATILRDSIKAGCNPFYYVLFTQLVLFVVYMNFNYSRKLLKYCFRQIIIIRTLMIYYLFGVLSLVFAIPDNLYSNIIKWSLLFVVFVSLILSLIHKKSK